MSQPFDDISITNLWGESVRTDRVSAGRGCRPPWVSGPTGPAVPVAITVDHGIYERVTQDRTG